MLARRIVGHSCLFAALALCWGMPSSALADPPSPASETSEAREKEAKRTNSEDQEKKDQKNAAKKSKNEKKADPDPRPGDPPKSTKSGQIDLAILLDTSNSMDGLINQARSRIWTIVNRMATAKKNGETPQLRIALYEYGNSGLPAAEGYIRQVLPFTDDLDAVSEKLFSLSTNGGAEYCGQVIHEATNHLTWSKKKNDLKVILIAGNEPFSQGSINYKSACPEAAARGIVVNTIHCGDDHVGRQTGWLDGAQLGHGSYSFIDQDRDSADPETPYDKKLAELSRKLNGTYLFYGELSVRHHFGANQALQDGNAMSAGVGNAASRATAKASPLYDNSGRDLIDGLARGTTLESIPKSELPDEIKDLPAEKAKEVVSQKAAEREELKQEIQKLSTQRQTHLAELRKTSAGDKETQTFDEAFLAALLEQAKERNFEFPETK